MKKIVAFMLCIVTVCLFAGCGNTQEYNQTLYVYYEKNMEMSDAINEECLQFLEHCKEAEEKGVRYADLLSEEELEAAEQRRLSLEETERESFDELKDPPLQSKMGYEIANRAHEAKTKLFMIQEAAGKKSTEQFNLSMNANLSIEAYAEYESTLLELKNYFEGINFQG